MNIITSTKKIALVAGVLGVCGLGFLAPSASAKPNRDVKEARRDVKNDRKEIKRDQKDLERERRENSNTNRPRTIVVRPRTTVVRPRTIVRPRTTVVRPRTIVRPAPRTTYRRPTTVGREASYIGKVVSVAGRGLIINVGGNHFHVDTVASFPRQLSRGDQVRVIGVRTGNTIRNARLSVLRNY